MHAQRTGAHGAPAATITIPAAYLEDVRAAATTVAALDLDGLRTAEGSDRAWSAVVVRRSTEILSQLYEGPGDMELSGAQDDTSSPLVHMLEAMIRQLVERLGDAAQFGPMPMSEVLDCAEKVQWAAQHVIRMDPSMATWLSVKEREAVTR